MNELIDNINRIHTTKLGLLRIKGNLNLDGEENSIVEFCKEKILDKDCKYLKQGKNWYCEVDNIIFTVNSFSYTIITAHFNK